MQGIKIICIQLMIMQNIKIISSKLKSTHDVLVHLTDESARTIVCAATLT